MVLKTETLTYLRSRLAERDWSRLGNIQDAQVKMSYAKFDSRFRLPHEIKQKTKAKNARTFQALIEAIEMTEDT